ncbi:MAG: hypothetical protein JSW39_10435, partial [Desulfobacterales bacterium]
FHVSEFAGFNAIMCLYFHGIKEYTTADRYYKLLKQVAPKHPKTKQVKRILHPSMIGFIGLALKLIFHKLKKNR